MKKFIAFIAFIAMTTHNANAQCCAAKPGTNKTICCPGNCVTIGANPAALDTCSHCDTTLYKWSPSTGLNNPNLLNPTACPTVKTVYTLTIWAYNKTTHDTCCKSTGTMTVNVNSTCCRMMGTSKEDHTSENIQLYPNPSSGIFNLQIPPTVKNATAQIFDINGRMIWSQNSISPDENVNIDLSRESKGVYFIKVSQDGKEIFQQKLLVQ